MKPMNNNIKILLYVLLLDAVIGFGRTSSISPFLEEFCNDFGIKKTTFSILNSIANGFIIFLLPYIGHLFDKMKTTRYLSIAACLGAIGFGCLGFIGRFHLNLATNLVFITVLYGLLSLGVYCKTIAGKSTIAFFDKSQIALISGVYVTVYALNGTLIPLASYELHNVFCWQIMFALYALVMCALSVFFSTRQTTLEAKETITKKVQNQPTQEDYRYVPFLFVAAFCFFRTFQNSGIMLHLTPISRAFEVNTAAIYRFLPLGSIVSILITFMGTRMLKCFGARKFFLLFFAINGIMLGCLLHMQSTPSIVLFALAMGYFWGCGNIVTMILLPNMVNRASIGKTQGKIHFYIASGSMAGSAFFSVMGDYFAYTNALWICSGIAVVFYLLTFRFCKNYGSRP